MHSGKGEHIFDDGIYKGEWKNDFLNGNGVYEFNNGDTYYGEFV